MKRKLSTGALSWPLGLLLFCLPMALEARMPVQTEGESPRDYYQFLFLYDHTLTPGQSEYNFHPFYTTYESSEKAYDFNTFLYPIFYEHGTNYWRKWTFLYLFTGEDRYREKEKKDSDIFLAPLFYWGYGNTEREQYFSIFPFYGRIRNKLGWSEIGFVAFPLYVNWSHRRYQAHSILWPIIMWGGDGAVRSDFRFLPFYSRKLHRGSYDYKSVLWPIFQWGSTDLNKRDPRHHFMFFPFYARKWSDSGDLSSHSILYPFSLVAWGYDRKREASEFRALWFLYQDIEGKNPYISKYVVFPFYASYRYGNPELPYQKSMDFYMLLAGQLTTNSNSIQSEYDFFIPFYYNHDRYYTRENQQAHSLKIWPLFHYYDDPSRGTGWQTISLWPFPDDTMDRVWGPLYSIAEWRTESNGDRYFGMLFRLYSQRWNEQENHVFFAGFDYHNAPKRTEFLLLGGLLGYSHLPDDEGIMRHYINLLWFKL